MPAPEQIPSAQQQRTRDLLFSLLLLAATFLAYFPCLRGQFVWDDDSWTTGLQPYFESASGLLALWIHPTVLQQYIPLTGTSFWFDYRFWGFWTTPYHIENILLHALAAILFWRALRRLEVPGAWLAGAIFALHPVMVESAAWITERKNVLSTVLFFSALFAYGKFTGFWAAADGKDGKVEPTDWKAYIVALFLFCAALLAKATTFCFPPLLLLLAWWKRGRLQWRADIRPALPFFAVAVGMGLFNSWIEKHRLGAEGTMWSFTFPERILIAGRALWFYAAKLFWPADLCFIYPRWHINAGSLAQWLFPLAAAALVLGLWFGRNRLGRGPVVAVLFYGGALAPLLGFMNIYFMRYSFVCDHWSYLPSLGLIALVAAVAARIAQKFHATVAFRSLAVLLLGLFAVPTSRQCRMYLDVETLYRTTLERNPKTMMAHVNLAQFLITENRFNEAIDHLNTAIALEPSEALPHRKLGVAFAQENRYDDAIKEFQKALQLMPDYSGAYFSLGDAYFHQNRLAEAVEQFKLAIKYDPSFALAYNNLGAISLMQGQTDEATAYYRKAVEVQPMDTVALGNLARILLDQGRLNEALPYFEKAAELAPDDPVACNNFAHALLMKGQVDAAIMLLRQALELQPNYREAHFNLGEALQRKGQLDEAAQHLQTVVRLDPGSAEAHRSLGIVLFRQRRAAEAIAELEKAVQLAPDNADACNSLAWILATCPDPAVRNAPRAVEFAQKAARLSDDKDPAVLVTLAVALAQTGLKTEAASTAQRALDLAARSSPAAVSAMRQQLQRYLGDAAGSGGLTNGASPPP